MNTLLKAALALVLAFGSMEGMVGASVDSQPGSPLYPVRIAVEKMGLTMAGDEVTETKPQIEFAQEQTNKMQQLADNDQDDACPDGNCDPVRERDRTQDGTCDGEDCEPVRERERDGTCNGEDCEPVRDRDQDRTCDGGNCGGDQDSSGHHDDGDQGGGDQGGGGHHGGDQGGGHR